MRRLRCALIVWRCCVQPGFASRRKSSIDYEGKQSWKWGHAMKITIESTSKVVMLNGVPARIWEGYTEGGVAMHAYVIRVAVSNGADTSEFERDLQEHAAPSPEMQGIPLRMVL